MSFFFIVSLALIETKRVDISRAMENSVIFPITSFEHFFLQAQLFAILFTTLTHIFFTKCRLPPDHSLRANRVPQFFSHIINFVHLIHSIRYLCNLAIVANQVLNFFINEATAHIMEVASLFLDSILLNICDKQRTRRKYNEDCNTRSYR